MEVKGKLSLAISVQYKGVAMGNPLAPTLAELFLQHLEKDFANYYGVFPCFYKRYVDDVFAVFKAEDDVTNFHSWLNILHPKIKFTVEYYNGHLNFLDTTIKKSTDGINISWFRKPIASVRIWTRRFHLPLILSTHSNISYYI